MHCNFFLFKINVITTCISDFAGLESDDESLCSEEYWDDDFMSNSDTECDSDVSPPPLPQPVPSDSAKQQKSLVLWLLGFILRLQSKFNIPDYAINQLLLFLSIFFKILGRFSPFNKSVAVHIPCSLYRLKNIMKVDVDFTRYVVCPKCEQIYHRSSSILHEGRRVKSRKCSFSEFRSSTCDQVLLKTVHSNTGRIFLYPFKVYCYRSIQSHLEHLLLKPGFVELCDEWKHQSRNENLLQDVYNGRVWQQFISILEKPLCLALMLNVDWFQPFDHVVYSVGCVYLTIMNIPRTLRYKRKHVLLVGIIPGPSERTHDINPYLQPLVNELLVFWKGIKLKVRRGTDELWEEVKLALLCCTCDTPAGRKVCGFLGHTARLGCCKCLKAFPGSVGCMNYSGFDVSKWPP